jgi:predicted ribosome quality control (RQC) complex YloA/Tae2 family protein
VNDATIQAMVEELKPRLLGRSMGKVFQLSRTSLAIDFRLRESHYLFLSVNPTSGARLHLIHRRVRDLEKASLHPSPFVLTLRKQLGGAELLSLDKDESDRIVRFTFSARDSIGNAYQRTLVAQLTGRAANLLLLDEHGFVLDTLRTPRGPGQQVGALYQPPPAQVVASPTTREPLARGSFETLSEAADDYYNKLQVARDFDQRAANARARLDKEIAQRRKLRQHLDEDLVAHGDALEHKRLGDLLLANVGSAERRGNRVLITDYYAPDAPLIELELDENSTLQEEATRRFSRYSKARRAAKEIAGRLETLAAELSTLEAQKASLEKALADHDETALQAFSDETSKGKERVRGKQKSASDVPGARRYLSSDGYEVLVGRAARDNDQLTFRLARPYDLWLHAADYPGSHVIVRNPTRAEIPHRTIIEAAQLAAQFSQARRDSKVDVHYTQRKFLSKPKGAAPGLVRMSSFRTITVEPRESIERI